MSFHVRRFLNKMNIFNHKLQSYIDKLSENKRNKYTIKNDMYSDIFNVLKKNDTNTTPKFKFWVRETFNLIEVGSSELIYVTRRNLPLITFEKMYEKITECHIAVGHSGRDKTWAEVMSYCLKKINFT